MTISYGVDMSSYGRASWTRPRRAPVARSTSSTVDGRVDPFSTSMARLPRHPTKTLWVLLHVSTKDGRDDEPGDGVYGGTPDEAGNAVPDAPGDTPSGGRFDDAPGEESTDGNDVGRIGRTGVTFGSQGPRVTR